MVKTYSKTVAATGTPEAITSSSERVSWATIQSKPTNTAVVNIRAPLVNSAVGYVIANPGDSIVLWSPASLHLAIDLNQVFIEVGVNGEGVNVTVVK